MSQKKSIIRYYEESLSDYLLLYSRSSRAMHYGYWDKNTHTNQQALLRLNEIVAQKLKTNSKSKVLDAGCGIGGTALWMAKTFGCSAVGVSLSPSQVLQAQKYSKADGLAKRVKFLVRDYTKTKLPASSFDGVFGIESICHLENKRLFMKEAFRLLKPGGRLVIADGMVYRKHYSDEEMGLLKRWLAGWGVTTQGLWRPEDHVTALQSVGFKILEQKDYSEESWPTAKFLFLLALVGIPFFWLGRTMKLISETRYQNALSCYYQYVSRRKKLWGHFMITAQKPLR